MNLINLFLLSYSFTTVSTPISYYTLSNPAFTSYAGDYQVYIEPKDIGEIVVFNISAKFSYWGFGFSNMSVENESKNWGSIAHHFDIIPLSLGINFGINEIYYDRNVLFDLGIWLEDPVSAGFNFGNILNEEKIARFGASYTWKKITGTFEIEDSIQAYEHVFTPHLLIGFQQPAGDFTIRLCGGYHPEKLIAGIGLGFRNFIKVQLLMEEENRVLIEVNFSPPVVVKEIIVSETLLIEKPVIIKKTITKTEPKYRKPYTLTEKDRKYCENHYLKGIDYYINDELNQAIKEWKLVVKVCPDYKEVHRYLENAREKLKLLKE